MENSRQNSELSVCKLYLCKGTILHHSRHVFVGVRKSLSRVDIGGHVKECCLIQSDVDPARVVTTTGLQCFMPAILS